MKTLTLQELGNKLPIELEDGSRPSFIFKDWRMPEEKMIGEFKQKFPHLGRFVREIFEYMLKEWDGKSWDTIDPNQRKLILSSLPWGSVFYMYVSLRVDALGSDLKMQKFDCPKCSAPITGFIADLNTMQVHCQGKGMEEDGQETKEKSQRYAIYSLKKPFDFGEVHVTGLKYGFTPWRAMENLKQHDRNEGSIKESMLKASISTGIIEGGQEVALDKDKLLGMLAKRDIEGYYDALDGFNGGPSLAIETQCKTCGHEFKAAMNWTYDYFFGNSSL